MKFKSWLIGAAGAIALGLAGSSAQAAPIGNLSDAQIAAQNGGVEKATWVRRCWWHRGHRHCRRVWRDYGYYYGGPYYYGPYAYGPTFGFYFGRDRHRHYRHRHHRHWD